MFASTNQYIFGVYILLEKCEEANCDCSRLELARRFQKTYIFALYYKIHFLRSLQKVE